MKKLLRQAGALDESLMPLKILAQDSAQVNEATSGTFMAG